MEPKPISENHEALLLKWFNRFRKSEKAHYKSANSCRIFNYCLGIPLVIITTIIASEYFSVIEKACRKIFENPTSKLEALHYTVIVLSITAPIIAALQTFLKFPERAEQHRKAALQFGNLKSKIEELLSFPPEDLKDLKNEVEKIQKENSQINSASPSIGTISLLLQKYDLVPQFIKKRLKRDPVDKNGLKNA